jgi:hypothetical protein
MEKSMNILFNNYNYIITDEEFLTDEEIDKLNAVITKLPAKDKKDLDLILDINPMGPRCREIALDEQNKWLYDKVMSTVMQCNAQMFHMKLTGSDLFEHQTYATVGSHLNSHRDTSNDYFQKKIRFNIQLSDSEHYEGGDMLIYEQSIVDPFKVSRKKGSLVVFASSMFLHEVKPITSGQMVSVTGCFYGPPLE